MERRLKKGEDGGRGRGQGVPGLDSQLWHACAGGMVEMPLVGSKVYYFPQGHAEHASTPPDFPLDLNIAPSVLCTVVSVAYLADADTDEVYARIHLQPDGGRIRGALGDDNDNDSSTLPPPTTTSGEKPVSFAKTLTQSDANNGGGFSVPRYCAETIFPRLDYSNDPPVQTVLARDVHGEVWKFRHIYRGTPRRHLLTTGWSTFVNQKKLVAGDAIVFLRSATGELCVGVRRSTRSGGGFASTAAESGPWHWPGSTPYRSASSSLKGGPYDNFSDFLDTSNRLMRPNNSGFARNRGKVSAKSVVEAATRAAMGQPFEAVYYPRASTPEFCVKAQSVNAALSLQWSAGMRFKMAFETEDSSRISWFMGTISSIQYADPVIWPKSPWRLLQVTWDEPDLLQSVKRVSPWMVEVVSNMPAIQMTPFMLPKKKLRVTQPPEFHLEGQRGIMGLQMATLTSNVLGQINPWHSVSDNVPAGMQGARHDTIYGISFSDIHQNNIQSRLFLDNVKHQDPVAMSTRVSTELNIGSLSQLEKSEVHNSLSCLLTMGNSSQSEHKISRCSTSSTSKSTSFLLFGKPIHTDQSPRSQQQQQQSGVSSTDGLGFQSFNDTGSPGLTNNSSTDVNQEVEDRVQKLKKEKAGGSKISDNSSLTHQHGNSLDAAGTNGVNGLQRFKHETGILSLKKNTHEKTSEDTVLPCKVFSETEEVGRTLDLTMFSSYEQLYDRLRKMFGIEDLELSNRVLYKDIGNIMRHAGEEPYGDFMKTVRRLTILSESGSDNMSR